MKTFIFENRRDFSNAVELARDWSNGRHYSVNAKDKELSIEVD